MKNLIKFLALFAIFCIAACHSQPAEAQTNKVYSFTPLPNVGSYTLTTNTYSMSVVALSATATAADTLYLQSQHFANTVGIQPIVTMSNSTVTCVGVLLGSLDGRNWVNLSLTYSMTPTTVAATSAEWIVKNNPYAYYAINVYANATVTNNANINITGNFMPNKQSGLTVGTYAFAGPTGLMATTYTVTNSGIDTLIKRVQNWYETVTIQVNYTKTSGTLGGTATLLGSQDGINWNTVSTQYLQNPVPYSTGAAATYTVLNNTGTQSNSWVVTGSPYEYYGVKWAGTGTMVGYNSALMLPSK